MWGWSGCNRAGCYIAQLSNKTEQEGGRELKGGARVTAATPHHGNSCLVILSGLPIGTLTPEFYIGTSHLVVVD